MAQRSMGDMVRDQNPVILPPTATVQDACRRMRQRRVGAVLVANRGRKLLGIFTGRDAVCRVLAEGKDPATVKLAEVMTCDPACLNRAASTIEALRLMQDGGFRHLPVIEEGRVVGIVSRFDFRGLEQARLDDETMFWERI